MRLINTFLFIFIPLTISSQITGKVVDENNQPLEMASVVIKNTLKGTNSNSKGLFALSIEDGQYTLTASFIGFKSMQKQITVKNGISKNVILKLKENTFKIGDVVIIGKTKSQITREKSFAVEVIKMEGIKNISTDINSVLGKVSGINIRQSGGLGSNFSLSLNGFSGDQVRVFIDGIPMNYFGSSLSLNNFPSNLIEQIEVYKGVVPIHLSSDALGGAINIITNKSKKNFLDTSYSIGSFGTHRYSVNGQYREESGFTAKLKSFYNTSKNNYKIPVYLVNKNTGKPDKNPIYVKRFHDGYNSQMIWPEIGFTGTKFADELMLGILFSRNFQEIQQPINTNEEPRYPYGEVNKSEEKAIATLSFTKKGLLNNKLSTNAYFASVLSNYFFNDSSNYRYFWTGGREFRDDYTGEIENRKTKFNLKGKNYLGNINGEYTLSDNNSFALNYSVNYHKIKGYDEYKVQNNTQFGETSDLNKQVVAINYTQSLFHKKLKSSVFGKYYLYDINSVQTNYSGTEKKDINKSLNHLGYGVTLSYQLRKLQLKASFENALRFPEILELFGNGSEVVANPLLKPEKSNNFNLGFVFDNKNTIHNIKASLNTFFRNGSNYIFPQPRGVWTEYKNTKKATTKGVDLSVGYDYKKKILISFNGSFYQKLNSQKFKDENKTTLNTLYNIRFPNEPYAFGNLSLSYKKDNLIYKNDSFVTTFRQNYTHKFYYKWSNLGAVDKSFVPKQYTSDLDFVYSLKSQTYNISFGVTNLFDKDTYDNFKQLKPGRAYNLKLRYFIN